jgi:hypothetical protein
VTRGREGARANRIAGGTHAGRASEIARQPVARPSAGIRQIRLCNQREGVASHRREGGLRRLLAGEVGAIARHPGPPRWRHARPARRRRPVAPAPPRRGAAPGREGPPPGRAIPDAAAGTALPR